MQQEEIILAKAKELFFRLGVRSITMDELAKELGISKKTIYKFVENKSDLVRKVMEIHFKEEKEMMLQIVEENHNAIDEFIATVRKVLSHLRVIHPSSIHDIQKYYPKSWALFHEYKNEVVFQSVINNLTKGVEQGLYRDDFNLTIITKIYISMMDFLVNTKNFPITEYQFSEIYKEFVVYHLRGVVSEKGQDYLQNRQFNLRDE